MRPCYGPFFLRAQEKGTIKWAQLRVNKIILLPHMTLRVQLQVGFIVFAQNRSGFLNDTLTIDPQPM